MSLSLAPDHVTARNVAVRLPALQASHTRLITGWAHDPLIELYEGEDPDTGTLLATIPVPVAAISLNSGEFKIEVGVVEGQVTEAGTAESARIVDASGNWWADASVSDEEGEGDIQLQTVELLSGAFVRLTTGVFAG